MGQYNLSAFAGIKVGGGTVAFYSNSTSEYINLFDTTTGAKNKISFRAPNGQTKTDGTLETDTDRIVYGK